MEFIATFPVAWKRIFRSLSQYITVAILVPVTVLMGLRWVSLGLDHDKTFEHVSPLEFVLLLCCVPFVGVGLAFVLASWFRLAAITVADGAIYGRNFWGLKNRIPLSDVTRIFPFHSNGINALVVQSRQHGQIYISDQTERLDELLRIMAGFLPADVEVMVR
jgi:hypothetical protein